MGRKVTSKDNFYKTLKSLLNASNSMFRLTHLCSCQNSLKNLRLKQILTVFQLHIQHFRWTLSRDRQRETFQQKQDSECGIKEWQITVFDSNGSQKATEKVIIIGTYVLSN